MKKIFIISGEVSGDILGAEFMREVRKIEPMAVFVGVGGVSMTAEGLKSLFPITDLSVQGVGEVIAKARTLTRRIRQTAATIISEAPDIVVSIDAPSFGSRVLKMARKAGAKMPFHQIVAPMVWAWGGEKRAKKYVGIWDNIYAFFDFEAPLFEKFGQRVTVIGYPFYNTTARHIKSGVEKKYIALLPGSRLGETKKILPIYKEFAEYYPEHKYAIPVAETTREYVEREVKKWKVPVKIFPFTDRYDLYNQSIIAVSLKGTATAELAIIGVPAVMVWKPNFLTTMFAKRLLTIKHLSMPNIVAEREIFPELFGFGQVTPAKIAHAINSMDTEKIRAELADHSIWHKRENPMSIAARGVIGT